MPVCDYAGLVADEAAQHDRVDLSIAAQIEGYVHKIEWLRQGAAPAQRDTYTVALGQLLQAGLITEDRWRAAIDLPQRRYG